MSMTSSDYGQIRQLHARYFHALDFRDVDVFSDCFEPTGSLEYVGPGLVHDGEQALRDFASGLVDREQGHSRHFILTSLINGDGDHARSLSYVFVTRDLGPVIARGQVPASVPVTSGLYFDDLVKYRHQWVYARRRFHFDGWDDTLELRGRGFEFHPIEVAASSDRDEAALTALDLEAIRQLLTRCGYSLDFGDLDGFVECFAPDAHLAILSVGRSTIDGSHSLRQFAEVCVAEAAGHLRQTALSMQIDGDANNVQVTSYALVWGDYGSPRRPTQRGNIEVETTAVIRDDVVNLDGNWLIKNRSIEFDQGAAQQS